MDYLSVMEVGDSFKEIFHESSDLGLVKFDGPEELLDLMV